MYMRGLCVMLCAGRLGAELVVFPGERIGGRGYFFSPLMREGFCLTKSAQFFVAPAEAERRGEEVRKWWQRAAARPSVASSSRGMVQRYLKIPQDQMPRELDATDGLAAALCHHFLTSSPLRSASAGATKNWADFVKQNPSRVKGLKK